MKTSVAVLKTERCAASRLLRIGFACTNIKLLVALPYMDEYVKCFVE